MDKLIKSCLDMDEWKHSWHNEFKSLNDYKKARSVIERKISERIIQLNTLNDGLAKIDVIITQAQEQLSEEIVFNTETVILKQ